MKFGPLTVCEAKGAILAHTTQAQGIRIRKGTRLDGDHIARLQEYGMEEVIVARLEPDDVHEDEAAEELGAAITPQSCLRGDPFTGRCNIHSDIKGLFTVNRDQIDAFNRIDPAITLATLPADSPAEAGQLVATIKIIPFAVSRASLDKALDIACQSALFDVHDWSVDKVALVQTRVDGTSQKMLDKTRRVLETRLKLFPAELTSTTEARHKRESLSTQLKELTGDGAGGDGLIIIIFGASAIADPDDVIPGALRDAGGEVTYLGMPVDPGNLLMVGKLGNIPVIGAPGCARSPAENGFDWVLRRLVARVPVDATYISGLGVGGLLMEINSRPQPREKT